MHWCNLNSLGSTLRISKIGVLVQHTDFLYITSRYNQGEAYQTLIHICLFVSIVSDLGLMSINLHRVENNNIWCLAFQFICRTWESLTFDMFSEDEEVSIRLRLFHKQGCSPLLGAYICQFKYQETWTAWWAFPKAGDCFTSDECEQCIWHVTLSYRDMWQYLTLTWDICEIHCDVNICAPTGSCGSAHWIRIKGAGDIVTCLSTALSIWLPR